MMDPSYYLSSEDEKKRYDQHNNDVNDLGYRNFVRPLVEAVTRQFSPADRGLDFGAGPGPVVAELLNEQGYCVDLFDLYYHPNLDMQPNSYDYIVCSEVIEHFKKPHAEFTRLRSLLKPGGSLLCFTALINEQCDFINWHYKNDPTHVFFYHQRAIAWIKQEFAFCEVTTRERLIQFSL